MATCDGLRIFEKPLPLESLSQWNHVKSVDHYSFTEIFGQLSSNENAHVLDSIESSRSSSPFPSSSSSLTSTSVFTDDEHGIHHDKKLHQRSDSISSVNSESVSTCTEELGFESSDDVDQDLLKNDNLEQKAPTCTRTKHKRYSSGNNGSFPPPISCIGRNGKPWVCFETVREGGRFILTEIRIPTQEFLHSCRKNGRLKMQFIHSDDEFPDEDEEEDEEGMGEIEDGDTEATGV